MKYRIRLAFEELVQQLLRGVLHKQPLYFTLDYAEAEHTATVTVRYGGDKFDPAESDNTLSYKVLKASVDVLSYEYESDTNTGNTVLVRITD